ncbi:hypothetical protein [Pseudomonas brassicacearum]|uniref:hypothetical protein n=1 Tax=Pseudomonas brassicacearum TaxID=930166 RepID=UPI001DB4F2EE|nr:hypothetical protein [Pseudomonas brassicacearum]CAH0216390.1 hypothetical protein SRABI06_02283 [Pseudomonas brassicacearum]
MKKMWSLIKGQGFMALLALVGFGLAIYTGFFYEKKPHLVFTVSQPTKVFDIHQPIGGLDISYAGESLRGGQKNLWVMTVVLRNEGNSEVRKGDYDDRDPVGLTLKNGQLLEQPTVQSDSTYITKNIELARDGNSVHFGPIIVEPGESLTLNLLVLGNEATKPEIVPIGKVAGTSGIDVRSSEDKTKSGVMRDMFYAERWWVQGLRGLAYTFLFVAGMLILTGVPQVFAIPFQASRDKRRKAERRGQMDRYRPGQPLSAQGRILTTIYIDKGFSALRRTYQAIAEISARQHAIEKFKTSLTEEQFQDVDKKYFSLSRDTIFQIERLEKVGLVNVRDMPLGQLTNFLAEIESLCVHLDIPVTDLSKEDPEEVEYHEFSTVRVNGTQLVRETIVKERSLDHLSR